MRNSNRSVSKVLLSALLMISASSQSMATERASAERNYKVAVQNVTAGNLLSPYLVILHKAGSHVFKLGDVATAGLQQIAETGATTLLQAELDANPDVLSVSKVDGTPLVAGELREVNFSTAEKSSDTLVTVIAMIGKSNDSFISSTISLSEFTYKGTLRDAKNYDAGTEQNTGNVEDLNATSHPVAIVEGKISSDRGLNPNGNAPEILRWGSKAAQISYFKL